MNKQNCPNCGCVNWQEAKSCIRCKASLSFQQQTRKKGEENIIVRTQDTGAISRNENKIPSGLVAIVLLAVIVIGGYVYLEKFSVDEFTKLSSFDQLYNGVTLPDQTMMKKRIEELNVTNRNVEIITGMVNVPERKCPEQVLTNNPNVTLESLCKTEMKTLTPSSLGTSDFRPIVNSFKVTSAKLKKETDGRIIYNAKYIAMLKGGYYDNNLVREKSDALNENDSVENAVSGDFSLNWNENAKKWEFPPSIYKTK